MNRNKVIIIYEVLYIKELDTIEEMFIGKSNIMKTMKYIICFIKKIFCVLTITEEKICILPYKKVNNRIIIKLIITIIARTTTRVVLSENLNKNEYLKIELNKNNVYIYNGKVLNDYIIYNFLLYIAKMKKEAMCMQEIYILTNKYNAICEENILYIAKKIKRINIITKDINHFKKVENYLEERFGIPITITNNKRKSLAKAQIIINLDFNEGLINSYNINHNAIIFNVNEKTVIYSKIFNGINILDYQILYDNKFESELYKKFDQKALYETAIIDKKYEDVIKKLEQDKVRIVNCIGKNGIINIKEYQNCSKNKVTHVKN